MKRTFVESRVFSAEWRALEKSGEVSWSALAMLQNEIMATPQAGDVVQGTGGLRKIRLGQPSQGRGKRGGCRVLFLDLPHVSSTHLLAVFGKREKADISPQERAILAAMVRQLKKETSHE